MQHFADISRIIEAMGQLTSLAIEKGNDLKWEVDELKLTEASQK